MDYLFTSDRLGFRNWKESDLSNYARLCSDPEVMRHFPSTLSLDESRKSLLSFMTHFDQKGYTYYAVETLDTSEWIGFIGLKHQTYQSPFTPAVDIGWRLLSNHWGKGYATEGAKRCLDHAFDQLGMDSIISVATQSNLPSIAVMKKIGMEFAGTFQHQALEEYPALKDCVAYRIDLHR